MRESIWPSTVSFARLSVVRLLAFVLVLFGAATVYARPSNPAFLGIQMSDSGAPGAGPCVVTKITAGTGAASSGLRAGDMLMTLDGKDVPSCDALLTMVQAREPGQFVKIDVRRNGSVDVVSIKAQLLSRDEVLRRRLVGQPVPATNLMRVDDNSKNDLSITTNARRTTIVGWFNSKCANCDQVLASVARWTQKASKTSPIAVLAATAGNEHKSVTENLEDLKMMQRTLDVPLLVTDMATFDNFAINDIDRVHFMVIDCRGVVQYVAPIAPSGDDTAAVLDELYAAAEQTARRMSR